MAGRLDPPHDRVRLSVDELRTLGRLEQAFAEPSYVARTAAVSLPDDPPTSWSRPVAPRRVSRPRLVASWALLAIALAGSLAWSPAIAAFAAIAAVGAGGVSVLRQRRQQRVCSRRRRQRRR